MSSSPPEALAKEAPPTLKDFAVKQSSSSLVVKPYSCAKSFASWPITELGSTLLWLSIRVE